MSPLGLVRALGVKGARGTVRESCQRGESSSTRDVRREQPETLY